LRQKLTQACAQHQLELRLAQRHLCTDNAAMVGVLAECKLLNNCSPTDLDADIVPNWELQ
jgi:tRNA A37 threonylcarbamoyltransferase TsaD